MRVRVRVRVRARTRLRAGARARVRARARARVRVGHCHPRRSSVVQRGRRPGSGVGGRVLGLGLVVWCCPLAGSIAAPQHLALSLTLTTAHLASDRST